MLLKDLDSEGWIATAFCSEIRVVFPNDQYRMDYAVAPQKLKYRIAAENPTFRSVSPLSV